MQVDPQEVSPMADDEWPTPQDWAHSLAEAARLMPQAEAGGLRVELVLPPEMAMWVLAAIARKSFLDPNEAVHVLLQEGHELSQYPDLRKELLKRKIAASMDDPRPSIPLEDVFARLKAKMAAPRPEPAVWSRRRQGSSD